MLPTPFEGPSFSEKLAEDVIDVPGLAVFHCGTLRTPMDREPITLLPRGYGTYGKGSVSFREKTQDMGVLDASDIQFIVFCPES